MASEEVTPGYAARLASARAAYIARTADTSVLEVEHLGTAHTATISFEDFEAFCRTVWRDEGRSEPLLITQIEELATGVQAQHFQDAAATARWANPIADTMGVPRAGALAGTSGPVAYVDVRAEGLVRLTALHEMAHLVADSPAVAVGHGNLWVREYTRLIRQHLGESVAIVLCGPPFFGPGLVRASRRTRGPVSVPDGSS